MAAGVSRPARCGAAAARDAAIDVREVAERLVTPVAHASFVRTATLQVIEQPGFQDMRKYWCGIR
jgi:hypothetical protein